MLSLFKNLWVDESGQDLVEYALLVALIAIVVIAALRLLGPIIATVFNNIGTELQGVGGPVGPPTRAQTQTSISGDHPWISAQPDWS